MWTREDQRLYNVWYYAEHRDKEIERVKTRQAATLEFLRDLRRRPCADCGLTFPPWVMDFDHRDPRAKSFSLAAGHALLKSRELLLAEIAKCDIVCANCHAVRTYKWVKSENVFAIERRASRDTSSEELRLDGHREGSSRSCVRCRASIAVKPFHTS